MSAGDVWGVETWHMNQSESDAEPGDATKDKGSIVTNTTGEGRVLMWGKKLPTTHDVSKKSFT